MRRWRGPLGALLVVLVAVVGAFVAFRLLDDDGGGGGATRDADRDRSPAEPAVDLAKELCGPVQSVVSGRVADPTLRELSGLVASRRQAGVLWANNDSGDTARLYALAPDGTSRGTWDVPGAAAIDWEDIGIRGGTLYVADVGDNNSSRPSVQLYLVPEPDVDDAPAGATPRTTAPATRVELRYPDRPHNAEALLVDPRSGDAFVVTKVIDGTASGVYRIPAASLDPAAPPAGPVTMEAAGSLDLGIVTAGDVAPRGDAFALRTYKDVLLWDRRPGESLVDALARPPCVSGAPLPLESKRQLEAIAFDAAGVGYTTIGEAPGAGIDHVTPVPAART